MHYTMLLPDNLLHTTMTAARVLIIFMTIIPELISDQRKRRPYMYTTVHAVSVKSMSVSAMLCVSWYDECSITSGMSLFADVYRCI